MGGLLVRVAVVVGSGSFADDGYIRLARCRGVFCFSSVGSVLVAMAARVYIRDREGEGTMAEVYDKGI